MKEGLYILDKNKRVVACDDVDKWSEWFGGALKSRQVALTRINKEVSISTVFLAVDHGFRSKTPVLWETMVFGGILGHEVKRCAGTWEQAEAMHEDMCKLVRTCLGVARKKAAYKSRKKKTT